MFQPISGAEPAIRSTLSRNQTLSMRTAAPALIENDVTFALPPALSAHGACGPGDHPRVVIDEAIAKVFGISPRALGTSTRGRAPAARARQVAMYVTHVSCGMSLTDVGALFSRDRTTVSHACAVIEDQRDDPVFDRVLEMLEWIVPELLTRSGHASTRAEHLSS
jgi:hypothetical protein